MRILIVDDEETEREVLKDILKDEAGVQIVEASNGLEAIDRLLEGRSIQLCLLDIRMPEVDGVQLLQRIRRDPLLRPLPVVVSSGNRDRSIILTLAQLGISGYLLKPFDPAKVKAMVQQVAKTLAPVEAAAAPSVTHKLLSKELLLVDDSMEIRTILKDSIKGEGNWSVVEAENGQEALELLKKGLRPNLCFCDSRMPVMDGMSFVKEVRASEEFGKLPIMILTGDSSAQSVRQFAELHVSGYIVKPFDIEKLKAILRAQ